MSRFALVEVYPCTGSPDAPQADDPEVDALVRTARRVCERLRDALAAQELQNRVGSLRVFPERARGEDVLRVEVLTDPFEGFEAARLSVPDGVAVLTPDARALLVLDALAGALQRLARARGWEPARLDAARDEVLAAGCAFSWTSAAKSSPDRRSRARVAFRMDDDGFGRARLEVLDRGGTLLARTEEVRAYSTREGWKRAAATLRWSSSSRVEVVPWVDLLGRTRGALRVDLVRPHVATEAAAPDPLDPDLPRPAVAVSARGADSPESGVQIAAGGGGPMNDVPDDYAAAVQLLLDELQSEDWSAWWAASAAGHRLTLLTDYGAARPGPAARRVRGGVDATNRRPVATLRTAGDRVALAHADVHAVLELVRVRGGLGPHPALRDLPDLRLHVDGETARLRDQRRELGALVDGLQGRVPRDALRWLREQLRLDLLGEVTSLVALEVARGRLALSPEEEQVLARWSGPASQP